ncbi:1,4-dihydroxy-2-naphthoate prenyltransferase [Wenjunlia vitaminophila]|uniref:1,4-dihydroxy-2-naphthoate prenyltransferase n=1 Tax=Wenjunlia vitaminophila TaxID=76728 RepID=A0A0T6LPD2_WENVI|nr:UbiA family prenyltransferase [Wenjunlia vitaminophila]KRV47676.1 1,4-dihydroxy-2-naphthoate prenyltransferase [Wenjunlia vitaminophila]
MTAPPLVAPRAQSRARAYARLAKLDFFDFYLSVPLVWALLPGGLRLDGRGLGTLLLFLVGEVCVVAAVVAFDDVTGFRDGSDGANYGPGTPSRKLRRKPLLDGSLTVEEAVRFGRLATLAGTLLWTAAICAAPHRPVWAVVCTALVLSASVQYSWGLKLSYRGGQEALIAGSPFLVVLVPYGLVTGELTGLLVVEAVLFGLWQVLVSLYSNLKDIEGDAKVGRRNIATSGSPRASQVVLTVLSAADVLLVIGASVFGAAPWWFALALGPVVVLRVRQFLTGVVRGDALLARARGMHLHRTGFVLLFVVNLVHMA